MSPIEERYQVALLEYIAQLRRTTQFTKHHFYGNVGNSHGQDIVRAAHYLARDAALNNGFNQTGLNIFQQIHDDTCNMDFYHPALKAHGRFGLVNINHEHDIENIDDILDGWCATNVTVIGVQGLTTSILANELETNYPYVIGDLQFNVIYSACVAQSGDQLQFFCVFIFADVDMVLTDIDPLDAQAAEQGGVQGGHCELCCGSVGCNFVQYNGHLTP